MSTPSPRLEPNGPLEVIAAQTLFRSTAIRQRNSGSLTRLETGRLLLAFRLGTGPVRRNDGVVMLTHSDDNGLHWDDPMPIYAHPGWDCLSMGGFVRYSKALIRLIVGRIKIDHSLGGDEPFSDFYATAIDSRDGGYTWSDPGPEIRLFPYWTEMYGASNPHLLSDGRYLMATMGTIGRDEGWHAGVTFSDPPSQQYAPPVIIAQAPNRNFSDIDLVRLTDGRFLAVIREHVTRCSFYAHSADEGKTWSEIRPSGFKGSNIKLFRLRNGVILCAYRDEVPERRGVSCSISEDGGETWRLVGQLYVAASDALHRASYVCGYPDMVYTSAHELTCILHTYPDAQGHIDLHLLRLKDCT